MPLAFNVDASLTFTAGEPSQAVDAESVFASSSVLTMPRTFAHESVARFAVPMPPVDSTPVGSLLPPPNDGPFPVKGVNVPARVVSGDFFDYYALDDGRIAFTLGDVSGADLLFRDEALLQDAKKTPADKILYKPLNLPQLMQYIENLNN